MDEIHELTGMNFNEAGGTKRCDDRQETVENSGEDSC